MATFFCFSYQQQDRNKREEREKQNILDLKEIEVYFCLLCHVGGKLDFFTSHALLL